MKFKNLEERMLYYRGLSDYRLVPNNYVLCMIDGRSFSHKIKKIFKRPFDDAFINAMNKTAEYVCKEIQGCKLAYVQSDEISFVITDFDNENSDSFFGYRLCKMQSIIASLATGKFNQLIEQYFINEARNKNTAITVDDVCDLIDKMSLYQFDCKCWTVPNQNDVIAWLLYRQTDCIKNSKQQAAQAYLSYKTLVNKTSDEQIQLLKDTHNIDWYNSFNDGERYGRFIYKTLEHFVSEQYGEYDRNVWKTHYGKPLEDEETRKFLLTLIPEK